MEGAGSRRGSGLGPLGQGGRDAPTVAPTARVRLCDANAAAARRPVIGPVCRRASGPRTPLAPALSPNVIIRLHPSLPATLFLV